MLTLRIASLLDGISFLLLLGVAMPLKYLADMPLAVRIAGSAHGGLFLLLCLLLAMAWAGGRLPARWCGIVLVCAVIPFAPFFLDRKLRGLQEAEKAG